jgi:hypothetical protein
MAVLSGCGQARGATRANGVRVVNGVVRVPGSVDEDSLDHSILGIGPGSTEGELLARLGKPLPPKKKIGDRDCRSYWSYGLVYGGNSALALNFCLSADHQVTRVSIGVGS